MSQLVSASATATRPDVAQARQHLRAVGRRYAGQRVAAVLLPTAAGALLLAAGRHGANSAAVLWLLASVAALGSLAVGRLLWPLVSVRPATIAARLDRQFPALEDSAGLLLRDAAELNLLEQLQQQRVARRVRELAAAGTLLLPVAGRRAALLTGGLLVASAAVWSLPRARPPGRPAGVALHFLPTAKAAVPGPAPARIREMRVWVTPPAYTKKAAFEAPQASFQCPQGSRVRWQVRVSGARAGGLESRPELEIRGRRQVLQPVTGQPGVYVTEQTLTASGLYRLRYAGTVSDDYAIDVRPDQVPVLRIQTPQPYTLAFGQRPALAVQATAQDDYGLSRAELVITVAQGQGEAVKFREVRRDLSAGLRGGQPRRVSLRSQLNLPQLGLTYGDELYFYLAARDNAGHAARTDAYLVQWQDTAVADGELAAGLGVKVAPAYFRSQRQIIIDTEKLLAEKSRLAAATLASRATALGFDQQTLRLRYGKFMGEEAEAGIGAANPPAPTAEAEDAPVARPAPAAETGALLEPYVHRHDDAETADFLEPAVKAKLAAVLSQMWAAELRLRTVQPAAALPYEYRALRLLKQVQQQTRAYVKKAGFVAPPLPEATLRLTGELTGAAAPQRRRVLPAPPGQPAVRAALRWLAASSSSSPPRPDPAAARQLEQAGAALAGAALRQPGQYLPALRALRQLAAAARAGRAPAAGSRAPAERALTGLLAAPPPAAPPPPPPDRLARRYFQALGQ